MKLFRFAVPAVSLGLVLASCSPSDQERARQQAEKAKVQVKQGLQQADKKLSEGGEKLKKEVKKATNKAMGNSGTRE